VSIIHTRGVRDTEIPVGPMGPMGIPLEWAEFMGMGTRLGMVDRKREGNWNSSLEEIPVSRVHQIFRLTNMPFLHSKIA